MDFVTLAQKMDHVDDSLVLAFDPGHTTGYAVFKGMELVECGEIDTSDIENAALNVSALFDLFVADAVVIEDYRVYRWRAKHHVGSQMLTTRVIGCIETLCIQQGIFNIIKQPAHTTKAFCTDKKLREWGFYQKAKKHANDAVRHGAYFLLFGPIKHKDRTGGTVG